MRAAFRSGVVATTSHRRSSSLTSVPPPRNSSDYSQDHADLAASILYRSPLPSQSGLPVYVLNAAAFPDAFEVDYDTLLGYVLARLPGEEELIAGENYEVIFFAGGQPESATSEKKAGPGNMWYLQAYQILSRAVRKRLHKLYVVHERSWVRVLIEIFSTIVSPKFKKKIVHVNTLSGLALHLPIEQLMIPPSVFLHDRRISPDIYAPYASGRRAFAADEPLPKNLQGETRLSRVLRETTTFVCLGGNLKTEGLFRIPAHSQLTGILREAYDRGQQFIVWKEGPVVWSQPGMDPIILREVQIGDTYNVHLAAGLIKLWYRELRKPIFEESCYVEVRRRFSVDEEITIEDLADVFSPTSTRSLLTPTARQIVTLHLLPLLSAVASYEVANKMTIENLAICFAPALVCGSDQLADAKMTSVIRRVLEAAVEAWPHGLREACGTAADAFESAIKPPKNPQDYEDPLYANYRPQEQEAAERQNILLLDLDDQDDAAPPPALPPRPESLQTSFPARQDSISSPVKRKPAPPATLPPRYSMVDRSKQQEKVTSPTREEKKQMQSAPKLGSKEVSLVEVESAPAYVAQSDTAPTNRPQGAMMKELKASLITDAGKRKPISSPGTPASVSPATESSSSSAAAKSTITQQRSVSGNDAPTSSSSDSTFARPTWPASARQVSAPMVPQIQMPTESGSTERPTTPGTTFKARGPSAGLLQRMASMEEEKKKQREAERLLPQRLGLKKASVDDLKRLYEDRATTVEKLNTASVSRRGSTASSMDGSRRASNASGF
ncbi:hypothetical protein AAFC00_003750 [Neodothiora populina]|uniref:Uncharacterized protein n=1 Tax=Neodothiora populina TaxID=2781224 RepID=A0ABR3PFT7_9PEZI